VRGELGHLAHDWWCRGGGAAVLALLGVVATFRRPTDLIFWAAVAFFVVHTGLAVRRWLRARRIRITATVTRHHDRHSNAPASRTPPTPRAIGRTPRISFLANK